MGGDSEEVLYAMTVVQERHARFTIPYALYLSTDPRDQDLAQFLPQKFRGESFYSTLEQLVQGQAVSEGELPHPVIDVYAVLTSNYSMRELNRMANDFTICALTEDAIDTEAAISAYVSARHDEFIALTQAKAIRTGLVHVRPTGKLSIALAAGVVEQQTLEDETEPTGKQHYEQFKHIVPEGLELYLYTAFVDPMRTAIQRNQPDVYFLAAQDFMAFFEGTALQPYASDLEAVLGHTGAQSVHTEKLVRLAFHRIVAAHANDAGSVHHITERMREVSARVYGVPREPTLSVQWHNDK